MHAIKARPARRSWMGPVLLLSDVDLLRTAGLDALVRPAASPASLRMYHAPLALRTRAPCGRLRCQGRDGLGRGAAERARPLGASPTGRRRAGVCAACVLTALGSQPRREAPTRSLQGAPASARPFAKHLRFRWRSRARGAHHATHAPVACRAGSRASEACMGPDASDLLIRLCVAHALGVLRLRRCSTAA